MKAISMQEFLAGATRSAAAELIECIDRLPEDKRGWSPLGKGRSALDQAAECAILCSTTADVIRDRKFPENFDFAQYEVDKKTLSEDWRTLKAELERCAAKAADIIAAVPDDALPIEVPMPWATMTVGEILKYPYWNLSYHLGQSTYISFLGAE